MAIQFSGRTIGPADPIVPHTRPSCHLGTPGTPPGNTCTGPATPCRVILTGPLASLADMTDHEGTHGPKTADYGTWESPLSAELTVASGITLREFGSDSDALYWLQSDADDPARLTLLRQREGQLDELTPTPINVRTRVNEYGGGSWGAAGGIVVWSDDTSKSVMASTDDGHVVTLTPPGSPDLRYAAFVPDANHRAILCVREDHTVADDAVQTIVSLPWPEPGMEPHPGHVLAKGADFYADPVVNDRGELAWVQWNQPAMPWDATSLHMATMVSPAPSGGSHSDAPHADRTPAAFSSLELVGERIALDGQDDKRNHVSIQHPQWAADGRLLFMSDSSGYWNLHEWTPARGPRQLVSEAHDGDLPMWQLGRHAYCESAGWIYYASWDAGSCSLARVPSQGGAPEMIGTVSDVADFAASDTGIHALVTLPDSPDAVVDLTPQGFTIRHQPAPRPDPGVTSVAQSLVFEGRLGPVQSWFHEPHNAAHQAPAGQLPPMIVTVHGGPTGMATDGYDPQTQFWTSRGYAVLAVNYSGSAGFGRAYRQRLAGQWGVADVRDCIDACESVLNAELADHRKCAIMGGSAGGFTVLAALTNSHVFSAGIFRYGIADLVSLQGDTHKFEARYNDGLLGAWPQQRSIYEERSPIHHLDRLHTPMLILQGLDDAVVPPTQANELAAALRARSLPVSVVMFEGEGHGFRKPETKRRVLEDSLSFLGQLFDAPPADRLATLAIEKFSGPASSPDTPVDHKPASADQTQRP